MSNATNEVVKLDAGRISDWNSFHDVCAQAFGFPSFYGRNLDAWIDCLTCLDEPDAGMTTVFVRPGGVVTVMVDNVAVFADRCPEQYAALVECSSFVNWRRLEKGLPAVLALAFQR